jgi:nucleoside-diphosphate-sugar epimerase
VLPRIVLLEAALTDQAAIARALDSFRPDLVLHLAWNATPGQYLTSVENLALVKSSIDLAKTAFDVGCPRFVGAGTCFEYDLSRGLVSEESPTRPTSLYSAAKLGLFQVLEQLAALEKRSFAWLRFFYLYGPFEAEQRIVASVIRSLLRGESARVTEGAQVRDFLHVEDAAGAAVAAALRDLQGPVNIGSGVPVTMRELVRTIGAACGMPELIAHGAAPYRPHDPLVVCADNTKLRSIGWKPRYDLGQGIAHTVAWWKKELRV